MSQIELGVEEECFRSASAKRREEGPLRNRIETSGCGWGLDQEKHRGLAQGAVVCWARMQTRLCRAGRLCERFGMLTPVQGQPPK